MDCSSILEELQSFLGFANYYREFVPFYAELAAPLNALLRKKPCLRMAGKCRRCVRERENSIDGGHGIGDTN